MLAIVDAERTVLLRRTVPRERHSARPGPADTLGAGSLADLIAVAPMDLRQTTSYPRVIDTELELRQVLVRSRTQFGATLASLGAD